MLSNFSFGQHQIHEKHQGHNCATHDVQYLTKDDTPNPASRSNPICTGEEDVKYVNINMHFIQDDYGARNFGKYSDGNGNSNYTGYDRAEDLVNNMNLLYTTNIQMNLPCGNTTDVLPIRIQYVLKGVYFHKSNLYINGGAFDWTVHNDLGVNKNTEINIYNINNPSITYDGIATTINGSTNLGVKIWKDYSRYLNGSQWGSSWETAKLLNHEVGHTLGLYHAWRTHLNVNFGDWCEDTPIHTQCWNSNPTDPCSLQCSNNVMDYNAHQAALTPCQIGRMHTKLAGTANAYVHSCEGCEPTNSFFYLNETVCLESPYQSITLDGRGSWKEDAYMIEIYQVTAVGSYTQIGNNYQSYNYTGTVGIIDLKNIYTFQPGKVYQVRLVTTSDCGGSTSVAWITTEAAGCYEAAEPPGQYGKLSNPTASVLEATPVLERFNQNINNNIMEGELTLTPNPAKDKVQIDFTIPEKETYQVSIWNNLGKQVKLVQQGETQQKEVIRIAIETTEFASGNYFVVLQTNTKRITKQLIIIK